MSPLIRAGAAALAAAVLAGCGLTGRADAPDLPPPPPLFVSGEAVPLVLATTTSTARVEHETLNEAAPTPTAPAPSSTSTAPPAHGWARRVPAVNPTLVVHVGPGVDRPLVASAVAQINAASGARWTVDTLPPTERPGEVDVAVGPTGGCDDDDGCTRTVDRDGWTIWAEVDLRPDAHVTLGLLLHELGHVAGLAHRPFPGDVMYPEGCGAYVAYQPGDLTGLAMLGRAAHVHP
jgi:hypothetical protein